MIPPPPSAIPPPRIGGGRHLAQKASETRGAEEVTLEEAFRSHWNWVLGGDRHLVPVPPPPHWGGPA